MKHSEEERLIEHFKELYTEFPEGILYHTDSPDIIVDNDGYKIGIELTEVFQDSQNKSSRLKELEVYHSKIGNHLVRKIEELYNYKVVVHLGFNDFELSKDSSYVEIVNNCLDACEFHLLNLKVDNHFMFSDWRYLPKSIIRVSVFRFDESYDSYYGQNEGGVVSDMTIEHIQRRLIEKHKKLPSYKSCEEYWLLIKEGNYYAGSFNKINILSPIQTEFDRVFILRNMNREIVRIK